MGAFVRHILFPAHEYMKGHSTMRMLKELERTQWLSGVELKALQAEKLRAMLENLRSSVPYYRDLPLDGDLSSIPFQTKKEMNANRDAMRSEKASGLARSNTGGSSGEPLIFYLGKKRISADVAAKLRATRWWGVDIGDREAVVWGSPVELTKQDRLRQVRDWAMRTRLLSAFDMSEEVMDRYLAFLTGFHPRHVFGYPSSISLLCAHAKKAGIRLDRLGVKVVFCTSERLYDHQRELIRETFGAPVANGYGGRDAGFIAHECPEGRMHVTDDNIIVEIIGPSGEVLPAGETGEIVVTELESWEFPFLRYRTGDVGSLSSEHCACGRGLTVLKSVEGRSTDFIVTPDRRVMHGLALIYVVRDTEGVDGFKIVQEDYDLIRVLLSVNERFTEKGEEGIKAGLEKRLGPGVAVRIEYMDKVGPEKSGKFRYVESRVRV
ncbi:MAG TPA: phenylacetate--CoA ligase family protein [Thermodesulfobacteriota bacterium]